MGTNEKENTSLNDAIKCEICLQQLCNPKMLVCFHSFCKECLDHLMKWELQGSGTIKCPLRCKNVNRIAQTQTTNDLQSNYGLQGVIDAISGSNNITHQMCLSKDKCGSLIQRSCKLCSCKTCKDCWKTHKCSEVDVTRNESFGNVGFTAVTYDMKTLSFQPYCEEHFSIADSICKSCENCFICVYCKHRSHRGHNIKPIKDLADNIRKLIDSKINSVKKDVEVLSYVKNTFKYTKFQMQTSRVALIEELKNRKFKKLVQVFDILTEKEKDILKVFDSQVQNFEDEFAAFGVFDDDGTKKKKMEDLELFKTKDDFRVVELENVLKSKITKFCFSNIPSLKFEFSSMSSENSPNFSLGQLSVKRRPAGLLQTFVFENIVKNVGMHGVYSAAAKKLKQYPSFVTKLAEQENRETDTPCQETNSLKNSLDAVNKQLEDTMKTRKIPFKSGGYDFTESLSASFENMSFTSSLWKDSPMRIGRCLRKGSQRLKRTYKGVSYYRKC